MSEAALVSTGALGGVGPIPHQGPGSCHDLCVQGRRVILGICPNGPPPACYETSRGTWWKACLSD